MIINKRKNKRTGCHLVLWQLYLVILLYISILSFKSLQGLPYLFATSLVTIIAFTIFARSIQERFIWLIALMPLGVLFSKQISGIYISPFDIACFLLCMEIIIKHEYLSFPRRKECFLAIFMFFAVLISLLLSPLPGILEGIHLGIMLRAFIMLFLFFISIKIFNSQNHLLQIFRALSSMIVTFALIYLLMFLNNTRIVDYLISTNAIGLIAVSVPCLFISPYARRKSIFSLIMCTSLVLVLITQSRTNYLIFLVDVLFIIIFLTKNFRVRETLLVIILLGMLVIPSVRVFESSINPTMGKFKGNLRMLALISNFEVFRKYPVLGIGYGNSIKRGMLINVDNRISYQMDDDSNVYLSTHNTLLRIAVDMGLVGLIPFFFLLFYYFHELFIKRRYKKQRKSKIPHATNPVDLIDAIVKVLFINTLLFILTWDIFTEPRLWMLFVVFSLWIKVKKGYEKTGDSNQMRLVGSRPVRHAGNA